MLKYWMGDLVGLMHTHRITEKMLAEHMGLTNRYVSMVLNGHREPRGAEERFRKALCEIIDSKSANS